MLLVKRATAHTLSVMHNVQVIKVPRRCVVFLPSGPARFLPQGHLRSTLKQCLM